MPRKNADLIAATTHSREHTRPYIAAADTDAEYALNTGAGAPAHAAHEEEGEASAPLVPEPAEHAKGSSLKTYERVISSIPSTPTRSVMMKSRKKRVRADLHVHASPPPLPPPPQSSAP